MTKILIVDDCAITRHLIRLTLDYPEYEVVCAKNSEEAIARIKIDKPDIILLDVMMNGAMDGFQLCDLIKSNSRTLGIYIILLTSRKDDSDVLEGERVKCDRYLTKPFSPLELLEEVRYAQSSAEYVY